jgi:hypothetical protein
VTSLVAAQALAEVIAADASPPVRVAQLVAEGIAANPAAPVRVAQLVAEGIAANPAAPVRVAQLLVEAVISARSVQVAQLLVEAVISARVVHAAQLLVEGIAANAAAPVRVAQALVEVIVSTRIIPPPVPMVYLSWSDDRGRSFSNPVGASLGSVGEYLTSVQWRRLGMGRDRVFVLEWSAPVATALQGGWIEATPAES